MLFDFLGTIKSEAVSRLALQALVYEICCLERPTFGKLIPLYLHLLGEDHVTDFFAAAPNVRPTAHHKFISNYSKRKIIDGVAMILPAHHLRRHVARCA